MLLTGLVRCCCGTKRAPFVDTHDTSTWIVCPECHRIIGAQSTTEAGRMWNAAMTQPAAVLREPA